MAAPETFPVYEDSSVENPDSNEPEVLIPSPEITLGRELKIEEEEFVKHAMEKRPEAVLPHVEKAAENGEPLEDLYEKRHERKDEAIPDYSYAAPLGNLVADIPARQPSLQALTANLDAPSPEIIPEENSPQPSNLTNFSYRQAIYMGLAGGICIVAVALIYILLK